MSKIFSERLIEERESRGWSKAHVAKKLETNYSTYTNWEYSNREPDYDKLVKIADLFEVTTDYLLGKSDYKREFKNPVMKAILELSDSEIIDQYQITIDNVPLSEIQILRLIAYIRAERSFIDK